jgi:hypothetical protein
MKVSVDMALRQSPTNVPELRYTDHLITSAEGLYCHVRGKGFTLKTLPKSDGFHVMILACRMGAIEWVRILLEHNVPVNYHNKLDDSPLKVACFWLHGQRFRNLDPALYQTKFDIVRLLIEHGADVNAIDYDGVTALENAVLSRSYDIVKLLLLSGADVPTPSTQSDVFSIYPQMALLLDKVYAEVTRLSMKKRMALLMFLQGRLQIEKGIVQDILQRPESRLHTADIPAINLERIIRDVDQFVEEVN